MKNQNSNKKGKYNAKNTNISINKKEKNKYYQKMYRKRRQQELYDLKAKYSRLKNKIKILKSAFKGLIKQKIENSSNFPWKPSIFSMNEEIYTHKFSSDLSSNESDN